MADRNLLFHDLVTHSPVKHTTLDAPCPPVCNGFVHLTADSADLLVIIK